MRREIEGFEREKHGKFRNNITVLSNIKTKDGGRTWKTRRESIAFKDTTQRRTAFTDRQYLIVYQHLIAT